ncbi:proteoglycan 4b isoform X1 [Conger conger]|uniref:proteoglycan 4b isoform X1 n=1 Tax=Conger conger TaxID=82655 RepID=UPI002A5A5372|nr:proteoglycan 4b isoform X1 [Conger conger]XP_061093867.1 proteoglycan 4b isoform X1 [Conger conger]
MVTPFSLGSLLVLVCALLPLYSAQESCSDRCGESYYRGNICHCDYDCLSHKECCKDYESSCTTSDSCKGRCSESFKRGRPCYCDPECTLYNQCCPDYQMHCGTDLQDNHLIPLSSPPSPMLPKEEVQGDEGIDQTPYQVPDAGPTAAMYQDSMSGQEPLLVNSTEELLSPDGAYTPLSTVVMLPLWSEQGAIKEELSTLFTEDLLLPHNSTGIPPVTENTDVSTSVPSIPEWQSDSTNQSPTVSEFTNPSMTPASERDVISHVSPKPTTQMPQEPLSTATTPEAGTTTTPEAGTTITPETGTTTTPEAGTAATPGTTESSPSATQSSDQVLPTNKPTSAPTGRVPSASQDETSTVTHVSSSSTEADDASTTAPSGTSAKGNTSVAPLLTGTAVDTELPSPATASGADTSLAGGDITNTAQTRGPTPADEAQNTETQPTPAADPTTAPARPNPSPLQPSKMPTRPSTQTDITQTWTTDNPNDYLPEDNNDTNLCSGRPISGLTTLRNGTVVVFRGHYFWVLDANRSPGPARGITDVWGIPSPIDTVFTRCQCEGKTYFIKGNYYWRFKNDVMDQGYPQPISLGFDKLAGKLNAALSVPATRKRTDSVYFFKRGGLVQKYNYKPSSACSRRVPKRVFLVRNRFTRQAASTEDGLGKEMNIKTWRGFPNLVTSAVSIPSPRQPGGYDYYIFSRTKYYQIKLADDRPTLATPLTIPSQQNSVKNWFNCP